MADNESIQITGFEELEKKLTITLPSIIRQMAFTSDASAAAIARKEEEGYASELEMGKPQRRSYGIPSIPNAIYRIRSKWDASVGWVSSTRTTKSGGPWQMAHFGWARGTRSRKDSVIAEYGSSLANLWAKPTKQYELNSPIVGQLGRTGFWKAGSSRPAKYRWSITSTIIANMADAAIAKTEKQFAKQFKEL